MRWTRSVTAIESPPRPKGRQDAFDPAIGRLLAVRRRLGSWFGAIEWAPAFIVASVALVALVAIVLVAILSLPAGSGTTGAEKGASIVAIATASFGVVGGIIGAFLGIKSATNALERLGEDKAHSSRKRHED
jgi:hypothetical protein